MRKNLVSVLIVLSAAIATGCSSTRDVKTQAYAKLKSERTFEYDFPVVWKGIESALKNHRIKDRDPEEVGVLEMKKLKERSLETDWIYSQSRDKYVEYTVNGFKRKKYLQIRYRVKLKAERVMGGTQVVVDIDEEIEKLKEDGSSAGFTRAPDPDSSRSNEILNQIEQAILAAPNI